jgi:hypothetical protein
MTVFWIQGLIASDAKSLMAVEMTTKPTTVKYRGISSIFIPMYVRVGEGPIRIYSLPNIPSQVKPAKHIKNQVETHAIVTRLSSKALSIQLPTVLTDLEVGGLGGVLSSLAMRAETSDFIS